MNYRKILISIFCLVLISSMVACNNNTDSKIEINDNEILDNNIEITDNDMSDENNEHNTNDAVAETILDKLITIAKSGDEKMGVCNFFIADSLHQDTPGGYGSGMPDAYYFFSNNTYFWDAGDYFDPMGRVRAKAGTWRIELLEDDSDSAFKGRLVLNEKYELYIVGDEIGEIDMPGGATENGLVNYTFSLKEVDNVIKENIEYVGVSNYSLTVGNANSPAYEYMMDGRAMFSNVNKIEEFTDFVKNKGVNIGSNRWIESLIDLMLKNETNILDMEIIDKELSNIECFYVTNAIKNMNDTYTLTGIIYTYYTLTKEELDEIVDKGTMVINDELYEVDKLENPSYWDGYEIEPEYGLYRNSENKKQVVYTIGKKTRKSEVFSILGQATYQTVWKSTGVRNQITVKSNVTCENTYTGEETTVEEYFSDFKKLEPIGDFGLTFEFEDGICTKIFLPHNY